MNDIRALLRRLLPETDATLLPSLSLDVSSRSTPGAPSVTRPTTQLGDYAFRATVDAEGRRLILTETSGRLIRGLVAHGGGRVEWDADYPTSAIVRVPDADDAVILVVGDHGLFIERDGASLRLHPFRLALNLTPPSLVESWISECSIGWLRHEAQQLLSTDDEWDRFVASALLARLGGHQSSAPVMERDEQTVAVTIDGPIVWLREAQPTTRDRVKQILIDDADALASRLNALADDDAFRPYDETWVDAFHACRRQRGQLEAVRWLFDEALSNGSGAVADATLAATLAAVDRAGVEALFESHDPGPADAWLEAFALTLPFAWWVTRSADEFGREIAERDIGWPEG